MVLNVCLSTSSRSSKRGGFILHILRTANCHSICAWRPGGILTAVASSMALSLVQLARQSLRRRSRSSSCFINLAWGDCPAPRLPVNNKDIRRGWITKKLSADGWHAYQSRDLVFREAWFSAFSSPSFQPLGKVVFHLKTRRLRTPCSRNKSPASASGTLVYRGRSALVSQLVELFLQQLIIT
ncbi:hypothetical protein B0J18DRAFT_88111 [Chaetomium sp. MPI-SDFR-AT-0129]|nr:hypothetical protein B0J18DRAFT_88111 [Chaetomium sp. MPI-SDFR-AT-0129]